MVGGIGFEGSYEDDIRLTLRAEIEGQFWRNPNGTITTAVHNGTTRCRPVGASHSTNATT